MSAPWHRRTSFVNETRPSLLDGAHPCHGLAQWAIPTLDPSPRFHSGVFRCVERGQIKMRSFGLTKTKYLVWPEQSKQQVDI